MHREAIEMLNPVQNGVYVDATIGLGGHSEELLKMIGTGGRLIGIDRDDEALQIAERRLSDRRAILKKGSFSEMETLIHTEGINEVDGILFDLGVSTLQLKNPGRGFSFFSEERLDMRMDRNQKVSAWDIVNSYPEKDLDRILKEFGEERLSRKIARAINRRRSKKTVDTCAELSKIVEVVYGRRGKIHPATRTFQALRIAVNREIEQLGEGMTASVGLLRKGGRICVISYHSLEDRVVKHFMREGSKQGWLRIITKKPKTPSTEEIRANPSSRSAKLRAAEKI
jgi:16S rRNA (cytosine1402-N4)-methyltransferase